MKLGVFYCTYHRDLCWVVYSAQLLFKHLKADFQLTIVAEPDCEKVCSTWGLPSTTYHYVEPWKDGYAFAMYQKSIADTYMQDADLVMLLDSDHILLEPATLDQFITGGKPLIHYREWDEDPNDVNLVEGYRQWAPPTERAVGIPLDRDYMRGPPFLFWRDTFSHLRERVQENTGLPFHDVVYSDKPFDYRSFLSHPKTYCDYEALGLYAAKFEPERYHVVHQRNDEHWPFHVFWSHGDWTQAIRDRLDNLLHRPEPFSGDIYVQARVAGLVSKHAVSTIVETGTCRGDTSRILATMAPVVTMELNSELYKATPNMPFVTRLQGDSAQLLPKLVPGIAEPILFYLDAHWGAHSPLLEELQAIRNCHKPPVIVIHDFQNPYRDDLGYDTWDIGPYTMELIDPVLREIYPNGYLHHHNIEACGQRRGVVYIEPM
jgi:hypothetical protein